MENATGLGLPWRHLREKLAPMPDNAPSSNKVHYQTTLELLETDIIVRYWRLSTMIIKIIVILTFILDSSSKTGDYCC